MKILFLIVWLMAGIIGSEIIYRLDEARSDGARVICMILSLCGLITLIVAILTAIIIEALKLYESQIDKKGFGASSDARYFLSCFKRLFQKMKKNS